MAKSYVNNTAQKEFIRDKWIEFSKEIYDASDGEFGIITLPAAEMQDLHLYVQHGLIEWEPKQTDAFEIKKGKVICFEKKTTLYNSLQSKLVNARVEPTEMGSFLMANYNKFMNGSTKYFPVHTVNLDFDGNISKNKIGISDLVDLIFNYQKIHHRGFSLFLTWPSTEAEDAQAYKDLLAGTISGNIADNVAFKKQFETLYKQVKGLEYDILSIIGITKIILRNASNRLFSLSRNEFYVYGEEGHRKMYSILFNFSFSNNVGHEASLYNSAVIKSLDGIKNLQVNK